jgi:hypothetical protein
MEKRLALTKSSSGTLLDQAEKLFHIKYVVEMKHERLRFCIKSLEVSRTMKCDPSLNISSYLNTIKTEVISNFLFRFQLTPEERKILTSSEISSHFFDVLNRVNQIRTDCKILLRTQHQRVGLEIMDLMADYLEAAYKKLYKWVRAECKLCLEKDCPEIPSLLRTAFHFLQDRPVLLAHCLEEIASQRQNALVRSFVMAVTQGGPSGTPRPIEMHAHDPQRYVSDMSAWIHQAVASEEELIRTLLSANKESTSQSNQENVLQVLNASLAGICHPFKMRVEHVLSMKPTVVVTYHLVNLLDFYSRRFKQMLGNNSILVKTFEETKSSTFKFFMEQLKKLSEKRKRAPPLPPSDLSPPHELHETVTALLEILNIFESSLIPQEERDSEITPIIEQFLDPIVQALQIGAANLNKIEQCVYYLNCFVTLESPLSKYVFVKTYLARITVLAATCLRTLVEEQATAVLKECGLLPKLNIVKFLSTQSKREPLCQVAGMEPVAIKASLRSFEASLLDFSSFASMSNVNRLISTQHRTQVRAAVADIITQSYATLFNAVMDPSNGYENPQALFRYKPEQIRTMIEP